MGRKLVAGFVFGCRLTLCILFICASRVTLHSSSSTALLQNSENSSPALQNLPRSVLKAFQTQNLNQQYTISAHLNPFYVRGDFNNDGNPDLAMLVKEKKSQKIGIAIYFSGKGTFEVVGAGKVIGNGGDNLDWVDTWYVEPKTTARQVESLFVGKSESGGGLIYWNGQKFVWKQQGD